jgi:hypothetical protein
MHHLQSVVLVSREGWKKILRQTYMYWLTHKRQSNIIIQKSKIDNSRWRTWSWKKIDQNEQLKKKRKSLSKWNEPYKIPKWTKPTPTPTKIISFMYDIHIISPLDDQLFYSNISQWMKKVYTFFMCSL